MHLTVRNHAKMFAVMAFTTIAVSYAPTSEAIPAFARKYKVECSACHSAMPYLNAEGRRFKEAGYRILAEGSEPQDEMAAAATEQISDTLIWDKYFPVSARFKGYVYDDVKGEEFKLRPSHEIEIFAAGNYWKEGSFFIEIEGEDEDGWDTFVVGSFGWHPLQGANVIAGYGPILAVDPYNSLQDGGRRLTVSHKLPLDVRAGGTRFRSDSSYATFYGRAGKLYYAAGLSGGNSNPEGEDPRDYLGRIAFDFTPKVMLGGLYYSGNRDQDDGELDIARYGIDFNIEIGNLSALGMYLKNDEELAGFSDVSNDSAYVELLYVTRRDDDPFIVPLVRYDWTERSNGSIDYAFVTGQVGVYPIQNLKLALEYSRDVQVAEGVEKSNRLTLLADVNF
ncbi:MAG TPA: hypothetical protein PKJ99_03795 [Thermoanaerobaculales bacterium]|nr:hypothetical protein [Thermoanaerobaculales bacterium]HPA79998.1 hypothetical protein [Thermoanaerobaculales bacterium]HQL31074.1 hypothetical protein [Thermoanaerobaculales bacterium]HQP44614.1 hypothetical protein [Thermoanaerobaculales bacterium]